MIILTGYQQHLNQCNLDFNLLALKHKSPFEKGGTKGDLIEGTWDGVYNTKMLKQVQHDTFRIQHDRI